jgi:hypothetical protein
MTDARRTAPPPLATTVPPEPSRGVAVIEVAALVLTALWLGVVGWFFIAVDPAQVAAARAEPLGFAVALLGIFLPVALIWVAASAARTARTMREEAARLHAAIDAMRASHVERQEADGALRRSFEERIDGVARAQAVLGAELAGLRAEREEPEQVLEPIGRPSGPSPLPALSLPLADAPAEGTPLPPEDFIRALNFPENDRDAEGFEVIRRALRSPRTAALIEAAQDLLTLLAQDGIYVDDLSPHRPPPPAWRAFAAGARGAEVSSLAGVRDRSSLALTGGRLREDPVFRDAVHGFLRSFEEAVSPFLAEATDAELVAFADTRTARAFMLTGRVAGTFDG